MNKKELLKWISELPEDAHVEPLNYNDVEINGEPREWSPSVGGQYVASSHYTQRVQRTYVLRIKCTTEHEGDFTRTSWGAEMWSNQRRTK
jgi:hypothetical protein